MLSRQYDKKDDEIRQSYLTAISLAVWRFGGLARSTESVEV
jgi:hypothetical protein